MRRQPPSTGHGPLARRIALAMRAATLVAAQAALGVMFLTMLALIVSRYIMNDAIHWAEELSRFCMIWMACLGAAVLTLDRGHVRLDLLVDRFPPAMNRIVDRAVDLAAIAFHGLILSQGILLARSVSIVDSAALGVSMFWPYLAIPVSSAFMIFFLVVNLATGGVTPKENSVPL